MPSEAQRDRIALRLETINFFFRSRSGRLLSSRFSAEKRLVWATRFGDTIIERLVETLKKIGRYWLQISPPPTVEVTEEGISVSRERFGRINLDFNPATMRELNNPRSAMLCEVCGLPFVEERRGLSRRWRMVQSWQRRGCVICGAEPEEDAPIPETLTRDSFLQHPRSRRLAPELREMIANAIQNEPSETVMGIARSALEQGSLTEPQQNLMRDRARPPEDSAGAPNCPVHNVQMRRRTGQYGDFYSCPNYPSCRITSNLQGRVRRPEERRDTRRNPTLQDLAETEPRTPTPLSPRQRVEENTTRQVIDPTESNRQGKIFRAVLLATINEKCGLGATEEDEE